MDILSEWGSLYVLLKNGRLVKLDELDTKTKLETLFKKNLYSTAIRYIVHRYIPTRLLHWKYMYFIVVMDYDQNY